ncbi:MAG: hypothetical protein NVS2B4_03210 [Ramlibacter sp.]
MTDIRRTILWVIFGFSMVLLWDKWQVHNGKPATFFPQGTTASASAVNKNLLTPYRNVTGKKTTAVVSVAASTGMATSCPPFSAAISGGSPISR